MAVLKTAKAARLVRGSCGVDWSRVRLSDGATKVRANTISVILGIYRNQATRCPMIEENGALRSADS